MPEGKKMNRCDEPGWVAMSVPDGRRGVWMRVTDETVELCAGREGDDAHVRFDLGVVVSQDQMWHALNVLEYMEWARDVARENAKENAKNEGLLVLRGRPKVPSAT